jgi:hypothetical protein
VSHTFPASIGLYSTIIRFDIEGGTEHKTKRTRTGSYSAVYSVKIGRESTSIRFPGKRVISSVPTVCWE